MSEEESPYAQYYNEGRTAGIEGQPSSSCPYIPNAGPQRRELLTRRMAWLEGHVDGDAERLQIIKIGNARGGNKSAHRLQKPEPVPRSIVQRRFQRRALEAAGKPERYVDRRFARSPRNMRIRSHSPKTRLEIYNIPSIVGLSSLSVMILGREGAWERPRKRQFPGPFFFAFAG